LNAERAFPIKASPLRVGRSPRRRGSMFRPTIYIGKLHGLRASAASVTLAGM
jgi:hypothetical protein